LDLLLHLIERSEVDIYDIPIASITEQFLVYLHAMEMLNLDVAGEFLVMAATLMQIKARMLLPKPVNLSLDAEGDEEEDPRRELIDRLLEYRRIKDASVALRERESEQAKLFPRLGGLFADQTLTPVTDPLHGLTLWDLIDAFQTVLAAAEPEDKEIPVPAEEVSVRQIMNNITASLAAAEEGTMDFGAIFDGRGNRRSLITAFIALLELIKLGRVIAVQENVFGGIAIRLCPAREVPA
jgi:segregation and condensation protein A